MRILDTLRPPKLPREHGGWAMLFLPIVLGLALTGFRPAWGWWIAPAATLVYLAHEALSAVADSVRRGRPIPVDRFRARLAWGALYLASGVGCFAAAWSRTPETCRPALLASSLAAGACGAAYAIGSFSGRRRHTAVELAGMAAMALAAPMIAAGSGTWDGSRPLAATALAAPYFVSSLVYVRAYDRQAGKLGDGTATCIAVHAALAVGLGALWLAGVVSGLSLAAFLPVAGRTAWGFIRPPGNLRVLGLREAWVAGGFAVLAGVALAI